MTTTAFVWGLGRRKTATARVRVRQGSGVLEVNGRKLEEYFPVERLRQVAKAPLVLTKVEGVDVFVNVQGGGPTGQAGAVSLGLARALVKTDPALEEKFRDEGLLTRDGREKERRKYGHKKARKSFQWTKR
ncbi:MAG: 30S ribosomal protein S9 [Planctomycetota bacterium]